MVIIDNLHKSFLNQKEGFKNKQKGKTLATRKGILQFQVHV